MPHVQSLRMQVQSKQHRHVRFRVVVCKEGEKLLPLVANDLAARKAPHWNNHPATVSIVVKGKSRVSGARIEEASETRARAEGPEGPIDRVYATRITREPWIGPC